MKMRILKKSMKACMSYDGKYREEFILNMNKFAKYGYRYYRRSIRFWSKLNNLNRKFLRKHPNIINPKFGHAIAF